LIGGLLRLVHGLSGLLGLVHGLSGLLGLVHGLGRLLGLVHGLGRLLVLRHDRLLGLELGLLLLEEWIDRRWLHHSLRLHV